MERIEQSPQFEMRERPCPTCGTEASRVLGQRGGQHHRYHLGVETRIVQCDQCRLIFPNPFPYARSASQLYGDPDKYFAHISPETTERYLEIIRLARARTGGDGRSLLDVGCGLGQMLRAAQMEGLSDIVGLEISEATTNRVRQLGLNVKCQSVEDFARSSQRTFDIVTLNAVLEHAYDPDSMVAAVAKLTHPGSVVYIDVPCEPNLLTLLGNTFNRLLGRRAVLNLSPTWPPYHVFGFNKQALRALMTKHGFVLETLSIWAAPQISGSGTLGDRLSAFVGTQINRLANLLHMSSNMSGWARRA